MGLHVQTFTHVAVGGKVNKELVCNVFACDKWMVEEWAAKMQIKVPKMSLQIKIKNTLPVIIR